MVRCGKCCTDLQMPLQHLLFPMTFLDAKGLDFYVTHGLGDEIARNEMIEFTLRGTTFKISGLGLIRPDIFLDEAGQDFYREHDFDALIKENPVVRVLHRCQHLLPNNACNIYSTRPQICRNFNCSLRDDCTDPTVHPLEFRR